jgi:hypothetical protein
MPIHTLYITCANYVGCCTSHTVFCGDNNHIVKVTGPWQYLSELTLSASDPRLIILFSHKASQTTTSASWNQTSCIRSGFSVLQYQYLVSSCVHSNKTGKIYVNLGSNTPL